MGKYVNYMLKSLQGFCLLVLSDDQPLFLSYPCKAVTMKRM